MVIRNGLGIIALFPIYFTYVVEDHSSQAQIMNSFGQ